MQEKGNVAANMVSTIDPEEPQFSTLLKTLEIIMTLWT
jgi:hypothetical protein